MHFGINIHCKIKNKINISVIFIIKLITKESYCFSSYGEDLTAVALGTMADVDPAHTLLVDELVERQLQLLDETEELAAFLGGAWRALYVGGTARHVVASGGTAHHGVETGTAVAAADINGLSVGLAQGVEDVPDQAVDVVGFLQ